MVRRGHENMIQITAVSLEIGNDDIVQIGAGNMQAVHAAIMFKHAQTCWVRCRRSVLDCQRGPHFARGTMAGDPMETSPTVYLIGREDTGSSESSVAPQWCL